MDMYMKILKPIIFTAHSELKKAIPSIKKSHLYEAFAAFCGFKSYAAFQVASEYRVENLEIANRQCFERLQVLDFDAGVSLQVCQQIQQAWEQFNIISLDDVYAFYSEASFEKALGETRMLSVLTSFIDANDSEAILVGLVVAATLLAEYEDNPYNRSGEFWYNKLLAGHSLNVIQSDVAEQYQQIVPYRELLTLVLKKFENSNDAVLPIPSSLKPIYDQFGDGHSHCWSGYFYDDPYVVIEAIGYALHCHDEDEPVISINFYLDWLKAEMIVAPSREGLIEIIEATISETEKWFWYYVGLQDDIDVTKDCYRAINADTGEDYDDYGPAVAVGDDGVALPIISDDLKLKLKTVAQKLIS